MDQGKTELAKNKISEFPHKQFIEGEEFLYLGKAYPLHFSESQKEPLAFDGSKFLLE